MPKLSHLLVGIAWPKTGLTLRAVHVIFVVDGLVLEEVSPSTPGFPMPVIIPTIHRIHHPVGG